MKKYLFFTLLSVLLFSCKEDLVTYEPDQTDHHMPGHTEGRIITEEEAYQTLYDYLGSHEQLRSTISNVRVVTCVKKNASAYCPEASLRSGDLEAEEVPVYEFVTSTGEDQNGFALVVGDSRFNEVIAYAPEGSLADTTFNEGLAIFMSSIPDLVRGSLEQAKPKDEEEIKTRADYYQPVTSISMYYDDPSTEVIVGDYYDYESFKSAWYGMVAYPDGYPYCGYWNEFDTPCRFVPVQWDQGAPYNNRVDTICNGIKANVGCVPVAIAQIMAYHKKPSSYNWNLMTSSGTKVPIGSSATNEVSRLMIDIAKAAGTSHGCKDDGTSVGSTFTSNIIPTLESFSYVTQYDDFNGILFLDSIYQSLMDDAPILCTATTRTIINGVEKRSGHTWIIDGVSIKKRDCFSYWSISSSGISVRYWTISKWRQSLTQFHCNWGWGGRADGWYHVMNPVDTNYKFKDFYLVTQIKYK